MKFEYENEVWEAFLLDTGTLDTTVTVRCENTGEFHEGTFNHDYATITRLEDGTITEESLKELAIELIEDNTEADR